MSSSDGAGLLRVPDCRYFLRNGRCRYGNECFYKHPPTRTAAAPPRNSGSHSCAVAAFPNRSTHNNRKRSHYAVNSNTTSTYDNNTSRYHHDYSNDPRRLNTHEHSHQLFDPSTSTECCRMFFSTGTCKYGSKCKYYHNSVGVQIHLNSAGLPIRPGEKECAHFIEKGCCRFGISCKFHHPEPILTVFRPPAPAPPMPRPGSFLTTHPYLPGPGFLQPSPPCNNARASSEVFQASSGPIYNNSMPCSEVLQANSGSPVVNPNNGPVIFPNNSMLAYMCHNNGINCYAPQPQEHGQYNNGSHKSPGFGSPLPQRPGEPDCKFYLKTGVCRYGANCIYNHPRTTDPYTSFLVTKFTPMGLPLRPGETVCAFYIKNGICKFGPACKYDHPFPPPLNSSPQNQIENGSTSSKSPDISDTSCATTETGNSGESNLK